MTTLNVWMTTLEMKGLPGLPASVSSIIRKAQKENWLFRQRSGVKGVTFEYHIDCLPSEAREAVIERHYHSVLATARVAPKPATIKTTIAKSKTELELVRQCPALLESKTAELTDAQRAIADSRCALVAEVLRLEADGLSRIKAINFICDRSRTRSLPDTLQQHSERANARRGTSRVGVSVRSLNSWVVDYCRAQNGAERLALLAPGHHKQTKPEQIKWLPQFLAHWRNLNGPTIASAYESFCDEWAELYADQPAMLAVCPSYDAVRRAMKKLPRREKARGRLTGSAARALETYVKRDWSTMPVNGCWISDGKSLNMKVAHPIHGRPFTPELTLVIDGRSRFVVGWSLALSENAIAVADAYRYAMGLYGKPLFVYSDNGGGETNKTLDADITGIFPRLGIQHMTSIPGNPQSRGIIERLNAVIPRAIAQKYQTYNGLGADRENVRVTGRAIESAVRAIENGKPLDNRQQKAIVKLPSWQQLLDVIAEEVDKYNYGHRHSELPKLDGKHMTPAEARRSALEAEGDEIEYLSEIELRDMFMPEQIRTAQRGWLELMNNQYFAEELIGVDGDEVRVAYDIHDASRVIVRRLNGDYVCDAVWDGNKRAAIPVNAMQDAMEKRRKRRLKLNEQHRQEIEAEARPLIEAKPINSLSEFLGTPELIPAEDKQFFFLESDRDEYLRKNGTHK
ncbi:DNA-binding protein [Leminorella grimontii]|uniref:DNA-binding protein n=1 Tax=Leminorella grimontii TaxID=82981 RepID=UPI0032208E0A